MSYILRVLIGLLILVLVEYYFFRKLKKGYKNLFPQKTKKKYKITAAILLSILNIYPLILLTIWVLSLIIDTPRITLQGPFYDYFLIYPFWIGFLILIQSALFFLITDIVRFISLRFTRNKERLLKAEAVVIILIILFCIIYVPARLFYDYHFVSFRETVVYREKLNSDLENFRLVFITDLQADRYTTGKRLQNYINVVNNANPDLVLVAGDFITSGPLYIDTAAFYTGKINAEMGVYSCVGDHDHWAYREDRKRSLREISSALAKEGIQLIHNRNLSFKYGTADILVTFVTNSYADIINIDSLMDLTGTEEKRDLKILLSHQPRRESINAASAGGYDLFLAGHTHGGQITFLFPFKNLSPTLFETKFVHGDFSIGDMTLIVNKGLGMSLAPIRYNSTPEVILIRFVNKIQE